MRVGWQAAVWLWCAGQLLACGGTPMSPTATTPSASGGTDPGQVDGSAPPVSPPPREAYDLDRLGAPLFATADYIELDAIARVSRFRSGVGHSYTDDAEACRSMKHYFQPRTEVNWGAVRVFAPAAGRVLSVETERTGGMQVRIRPQAEPAFVVILFHVVVEGIAAGDVVRAGQSIGRHVGSQTMSDVAVGVATPVGYRLVSWFDVVSDQVFARYRARGLASRGDAIISRVDRDASPLRCSGESFTDGGVLENWVALR
ncbi:MAG: M23 family metallopeptidase [Acidimicrobiia bacterium]|nr:M23 family metallopeptidase [Acidimicrobiia bacterium]